ncbi:calcium-activated chloride channel-domain-containing protein [Cantharellus anzutake]|uniref:calcium-activated chloride channel-domain-containing protein n=1 Tax=Cantharellus anzutake TaxID=1750568 RepID=UPI0019035EB3|nr:calcium-activated chloride channel-domain-containing protein [Cantharellus anzutake]KAF8323489.1 calcium-activated chloride channel-domain-containing protein [Cantharellus anzutake]
MRATVDLVLVYDGKAQDKESAQEVSKQYENLVSRLKAGGLNVAGKKGARQGQILVAVHCGDVILKDLEKRERARDFKSGVSISAESTRSISPAQRIRLVYEYIITNAKAGGLGIAPRTQAWSRLESIFALHDHQFNDNMIKSWKAELDISAHLDSIKDHFGESIALYFGFLTFYAKSLVWPTALGLGAYFFTGSFDTTYSVLLILWAVTFVEAWRIKERSYAVKWGVTHSSRVESLRSEFDPNDDIWWKRELRIIGSIPIIGLFAVGLSALITAIFVFEAFISQLYGGPGHRYIAFAPTIIFILTIPKFLSFYHVYAKRLTNWENHSTHSSYDRSLTLKTFVLSGIVAYLNLTLSAFVYVPFGTGIMQFVQSSLTRGVPAQDISTEGLKLVGWWTIDHNGHQVESLRGVRLRDQVLAFTLTGQAINFVQEVVIPFLSQGFEGIKKGRYGGGRGKYAGLGGRKKRVEWEDEKDGNEKVGMNKEDWELVYRMRDEVGLEEYTLFEMVTQFGYITVWSTCWPLASLSVLANNWVELRSDAFKITRLVRRPIPSRTESIGAWLDSLSFITWLGALINAALVYLFNPHFGTLSSQSLTAKHTTASDTGLNSVFSSASSRNTIMIAALLTALASSHAYIGLRVVVRHVLERVMWKGSEEEKILEDFKVKLREAWLEEHGVVTSTGDGDEMKGISDSELSPSFWEDEGLAEIQSAAKTE